MNYFSSKNLCNKYLVILVAKFRINLENNYNFVFITITILIVNNFLFCKLVSNRVILISES